MMKSYIFLFFFLMLASWGRTQTFEAGLILGVNASQVNGDFLAGYDKLGLHTGLKVRVSTWEHIEWSVELLLSQRGSRPDIFTEDSRKIHLNYVEIPILIGFKDWQKDDFYKIRFEGGFSYGRMVGHKVSFQGVEEQIDEFNNNDLSFIIGAALFTSEKLGFSFRYTHSVTPLLNNKNSIEFARLRGFFLTFRSIYML
ncbi:MAG: PorT family protein [Saprospiraceae bacterium]|nr:PorT family protein [Saprospiraceae bacterium]